MHFLERLADQLIIEVSCRMCFIIQYHFIDVKQNDMVVTFASNFCRSVVVMRVTRKPIRIQLSLPSIKKQCGMCLVDFIFSKQVWLFVQSFVQCGDGLAVEIHFDYKHVVLRKGKRREKLDISYLLAMQELQALRAVTWNRNHLPAVGGTAEISSTSESASLPGCWCCT